MSKNIKYLAIILFVGILAWYKVLGFWFFKAYEATWLMGIQPFNIINLIKGHGFLYFIDYKIFGWNPMGWYATGLLLHLIASLLFFYLISLLSKNKLLAFISSLFFVASTAYHDVLTWASFNSYYPLLLSSLLLTLITYHRFKETKKTLFLFLSLIFSFLGFYIRETGIIIVPLLFVYEIIFSKNIKDIKTIIKSLKCLLPFVTLLILFFVLRTTYGGTGGDSADGNVQLQMRFVKDRLYFEYAKSALFTFGKLIPPQIIPYTLLNAFRKYVSKFICCGWINTYFFPILGWLIFAGFGEIIFLLRKSKQYFKIFLFFWIWLGLFSLFVSLAIPNTPELLPRAYEYNTMRYRYFAFLGTSVLLAGLLMALFSRKSKTLMFSMVFGVVFVNLLMLWKIEKNIYNNIYKPQKEFYTTFKRYFPSLPKNVVFYINPNASGLSDYLLEWFLIKEKSYPNLVGEPFRVESQMIAVINKIKKGEIKLDEVFFLDYDQKLGLLDKTNDVKNILENQKEYQINLLESEGNIFMGELQGPSVEFPYDLETSLSLRPKESFIGNSPDSFRFKALVEYAVEKNEYLKSVSIKTVYTASQREGEPFFFAISSHLMDGNTGLRSRWIADSFAPWVQVDLGKEKEILGVVWGSHGETRIPATYSIFTSQDGETWIKTKAVKNFNKPESIDVFDKPVRARYIKMEIYTTSGGSFVVLDEFEVISTNSRKVLEVYTNRKELLDDSHNLYKFVSSKEDLNYAESKGLNVYWGKISWETNKPASSPNNQYLYFPYKIDNGEQKISIRLPEAEIYAGEGQFLNKYITSVSLDFGDMPYIINVSSSKLMPRNILE